MSVVRALAALVLLLTVAPSHADGTNAPADSTASGERVSYWGPFPDRADSVVAVEKPLERDAWEVPVDAVWWLVRLPFTALHVGLRETTVWLDESGTFERIKRFFAPLDLPWGFSLGGSAGRLSGVTGSVGFYHDSLLVEGGRFRANTSLSTVGDQRYSGGWIAPDPWGGMVELGGGYRLRTRARYFGIGPGTSDDDESFFTRELGWVGMGYAHDVYTDALQLEGQVLWSSMGSRTTREPDEERPLTDVFSGADLPTGYGDVSRGLGFDLGLVHDTTQQDGRPRHAGLRILRAGYFLPEDDAEADFFHYRGEFQQFFDAWWDRAFAVRGYVAYIDSDGEPVHFQRMLTNDDPDVLRGYEDFRWRDRGMTALTVEYRWPIWDYRDPGGITADAYTFYDGGQVFGDREEIALENLAHSYGFGVRLSMFGRFGGRVEVGFSEEDTVFRLRGDQLFQFGKDGLYHGRDPIPTR